MVRHGVVLTAAGIVGGLLLSLGCARLVDGFLFGVSAWDASTYLGAASVLFAVGVGATIIAAFRSSEANPMTLMRKE